MTCGYRRFHALLRSEGWAIGDDPGPDQAPSLCFAIWILWA